MPPNDSEIRYIAPTHTLSTKRKLALISIAEGVAAVSLAMIEGLNLTLREMLMTAPVIR